MIVIVFSRRKLIFFSCHSLLHLFQAALHLQPFFQLLKVYITVAVFSGVKDDVQKYAKHPNPGCSKNI